MRTKTATAVTFEQLNPRTQVKIEKRARREGKTPEAVAAFILDNWVGGTRKRKPRNA